MTATRLGVLALFLGGLTAHLWLGSRIGLAAAALALAVHVVGVVLARRHFRRP
ncbi:hypothetical protein ACWDSJ_01085 [Nocardia sp. NPDC003482]